MATPTIPNGEEYFFPIIYEGNGGGQRVGKFVPFTDNGTIANSCIFNSADTARMNVDFTSSGTNTKKCTISFWFKLGKSTTATGNLISAWGGTGYLFQIFKYADNHGTYPSSIMFQHYNGGAYNSQIRPNRTFEDRSKWYHLMYVWDSTESTAADRIKIYIDGDQITSFSTSSYPSSNDDFVLTDKQSGDNTTVALGTNASQIGSTENQLYDGYLAEVNVVDGTALTPSTFGVTDTSTMRWIPKTLSGITYGTNGFRLKFQDSSALGDDTSGNTNDFTVANLASTDQTTDSPTQNFATFSPGFSSSSMLLSEGNLTVTDNANANYESAYVGMPVQSGKYYFEITIDVAPQFLFLGVNNLSSVTANKNQYPGYADGSASFLFHTSSDKVYYGNNGGNYYSLGSATTLSNGDKVGVAYDADTGAFWVAKNNSWLYSGNPSTGANPLFTGYTPNELVYFSTANWYSTVKQSYNFGQRSFAYTPPTDFVALQQDNLPETAKGISGLVWTKNRDATDSHQWYDSSRGKQLSLASNTQSGEATVTDGLQKFLAGGQQIEDDVSINTAGESFVSWNWVANGGTTASNSDGSYSSTVQVNQTAGFSIVQFTPGASSGTVGHGLSQAPEWIVMKDTSRSVLWLIYHKDVGADKYLQFTTAAAASNSTVFSTEPTATTFDPGNGYTSGSSYGATVAYCWHSVDGFSKFGSYTGNGSTDGPFIYTGFKPAWIMWKRTNSTNQWVIHDSTRNPFNPTNQILYANITQADGTGDAIVTDLLSNGFKLRSGTNGNANTSGSTYIYMAFAEHPFVGDGTNPVTAR